MFGARCDTLTQRASPVLTGGGGVARLLNVWERKNKEQCVLLFQISCFPLSSPPHASGVTELGCQVMSYHNDISTGYMAKSRQDMTIRGHAKGVKGRL